MTKLEKVRKDIQPKCKHRKIIGTEGFYNSVTWQCKECELDIEGHIKLLKGTIISFWSKARLKRDCYFDEIKTEDQQMIYD